MVCRPDLRVLTVNAGSSSLKLRVIGPADELLGSRDLPPADHELSAEALRDALAELPAPDAVGHRIVHGGELFREPVCIDDGVEVKLRELTALAPLHQFKSLSALGAIGAALPGRPAVACFDTAFHATIPDAAATYALPAAWNERYGLRRYGFHGLSHAYAARRAAEMLRRGDLRLVSCHLGAGASLAAVVCGRCVDTTMGFTPLEGLVMATRSGSVDPGLLLWVLEHEVADTEALAHALEHESGLLGLAGTADMRTIVSEANRGSARAAGALDVYVHRLAGSIAAMVASTGGVDALVFTGGVGENSAAVRTRAVERLAFLGIALDSKRNDLIQGDGSVEADGSDVAVLVVASREDLEIARGVRRALGRHGQAGGA